jgi:nitroimidazol reductase NimA-like FMN-containing flavoprotein (pyridoxamine 5'-phosphate oxidase superfamily)
MRRHDKEITNRHEIDEIIHTSQVCRIAFADAGEPYVVPMSYGYDGKALFIHTANRGRKIDFIQKNTRVCFELEANVALKTDDSDACNWTFEFESLIGYGRITELETAEDKAHGLNQIMLHYSRREWEIDEAATATTRVWRIDVESVTGKRTLEKPNSST